MSPRVSGEQTFTPEQIKLVVESAGLDLDRPLRSAGVPWTWSASCARRPRSSLRCRAGTVAPLLSSATRFIVFYKPSVLPSLRRSAPGDVVVTKPVARLPRGAARGGLPGNDGC